MHSARPSFGRDRSQRSRSPAGARPGWPDWRSAQVDGDLKVSLGGEMHLLEVDPFILGVGLGDVAGPEDDAGRSFLAERARVGSERNSHQDEAGGPSRSRSRVSEWLDPVGGSRSRAAACAPRAGSIRRSRVRSKSFSVQLLDGLGQAAAASSPGIRRRSTSISHQSGTTLTLCPPSIRPTDKLGGPRIGSGGLEAASMPAYFSRRSRTRPIR